MEEIWLDLPFAPDAYEVSNYGKVRSKTREVVRTEGKPYHREGAPLTLRNNGIERHLFFEVSKYEDRVKRKKTFYIHKVVAQLFLPKTDEKQIYVTHIDGDHNNNVVTNLRWITASEHAKKVVNAEKAWITRRERYGKHGGSYGRAGKPKDKQ
ncbi:MAG: HNH endonuclease [Bacteroidia bacterium]